jgi:sugar (pentulose or hexulose) kinase
MSDVLLLGIDVGTSNCKAAVVDAAGAELAHGSTPTPWQRVPTGAQIEPDALLAAAVEAAREALARAPAGRVAGIGVTSMGETGVLLDADGAPVAPAIAWYDARGAGEAQAIADELGAETFTEHTGLPPSPLCSLAKLRWLAANVPAARAGRRWLNVGEWIVRGLGGSDVCELSLASRSGLLDLAARAPYASALDWGGLPQDLLGEIVVAGTPAGTCDAGALPGAEGAVLTVAGHDHPCAGVGVGVVAPGDVLDSCGTAEALIRVAAPPLGPEDVRRCVASGITVGWHVAEGRQALLGSLWSGLALREVLEALGADREAIGAQALATHEAIPPLDLELHSLDRRPLDLPDAPPGVVWRAAIDACEAEVASLLDRMAAITGPHRRILVTGGWSRDEAVMQSKNAVGAVEAPPVTEAGARGAGLIAGVAAGVFAGIDDLPPIPAPVPARRS